jgi:hypothetical protein
MSEIKTGGLAFPSAGAVFKGPNGQGMANEASFGMTLRDYFAAKAMQGLIAGTLESSDTGLIARDCYALADAMLKARDQNETANQRP